MDANEEEESGVTIDDDDDDDVVVEVPEVDIEDAGEVEEGYIVPSVPIAAITYADG